MKKLFNIIFAFFSGFIFLTVLSFIEHFQKKKNEVTFVYKGFQDYSVELLGKNFQICSYEPKSVDCLKPMVSKPQTAIKIAISIFESKYGSRFLLSQEPFDVTLINNKVWCVKGHKGAIIYIQKKDAKILSINNKF